MRACNFLCTARICAGEAADYQSMVNLERAAKAKAARIPDKGLLHRETAANLPHAPAVGSELAGTVLQRCNSILVVQFDDFPGCAGCAPACLCVSPGRMQVVHDAAMLPCTHAHASRQQLV